MIAATLQKGTGSLIVKGGNPLVLLQLGNEVLNQVSPAILVSVELPASLLVLLPWIQELDPLLLIITESVASSNHGSPLQWGKESGLFPKRE